MSIHEENPVMISTAKCATVAAGASEELPIFVAPFDCYLLDMFMTDDAGFSGDDTNYSTLSFQRKGTAGSGTDEIASKAFVTGVDATVRVPYNVGALHKDYRFIPKGTAVTYKKVHTLTGIAFTDPIFSVKFVAA